MDAGQSLASIEGHEEHGDIAHKMESRPAAANESANAPRCDVPTPDGLDYQGPEFRAAMKQILVCVNVEIVKRSDQAKGFVTLPKRWIVERTFAWLGRCRRLAKD